METRLLLTIFISIGYQRTFPNHIFFVKSFANDDRTYSEKNNNVSFS